MDRGLLIDILARTRRFVAQSLLSVLVLSIVVFPFSRTCIASLAGVMKVKLYYFTLPDVLFATIQTAIYASLLLSMPAVIFFARRMLRGVAPSIPVGFSLPFFAMFLFYGGVFFCFFVVLPSGIGFLLSYGTEVVKATISVRRFVGFCGTMLFAFGLAFELPLALLLLSKARIIRLAFLRRTRRFAVLFIVIAAAAITPTPDLFNMSLLAVPLYALYEIGLLLVRFQERRSMADSREADLGA